MYAIGLGVTGKWRILIEIKPYKRDQLIIPY